MNQIRNDRLLFSLSEKVVGLRVKWKLKMAMKKKKKLEREREKKAFFCRERERLCWVNKALEFIAVNEWDPL